MSIEFLKIFWDEVAIGARESKIMSLNNGKVLVKEIARPRVQFVIKRYESFWQSSKLHEPLGECNLRTVKTTSTYYSRIVPEGRVIFYL